MARHRPAMLASALAGATVAAGVVVSDAARGPVGAFPAFAVTPIRYSKLDKGGVLDVRWLGRTVYSRYDWDAGRFGPELAAWHWGPRAALLAWGIALGAAWGRAASGLLPRSRSAD